MEGASMYREMRCPACGHFWIANIEGLGGVATVLACPLCDFVVRVEKTLADLQREGREKAVEPEPKDEGERFRSNLCTRHNMMCLSRGKYA